MQGQSSDFQARAAERLFVEVVNQAIMDVLEHGEEAEDAERWLPSVIRVREGLPTTIRWRADHRF